MRIVETTDACKIYGINHTVDNRIIWEQKTGTPYALVCILQGGVPSENEFLAILEHEEQNIKADYIHHFNGGSIKLSTIEHDKRMFQVNQTGVTAGVFAADLQDDELILYGYSKTGMFLKDNFCTIRTNVDISCKKQSFTVRSGGLFYFRRTITEKHYYEVVVTSRGVYKDGDVYYKFGGYKYPIPAAVIGEKFYVEAVENSEICFGKNESSAVNLSAPQAYKIRTDVYING